MALQFDHKYSLLLHNSLGVPAVCDAYIEINDSSELSGIIEYATENKFSVFVLGEGTNLVLHQQVPGLVIKPKIMGRELLDEANNKVKIRVGAGENWHELVCWTLEQGYYGLENLALIPGSCGAAPVQNIGAYGVEISQFIEAVDYVDLVTRVPERLANHQCQFDYRDSIFKRDLANRSLITHIELCLSKHPSVNISYSALKDFLATAGEPLTSESVFDAVCALRRSKLPDIQDVPNVGSFFKNPIIPHHEYQSLVIRYPEMPGYPYLEEGDGQSDLADIKVPAAWLIDYLGWKGRGRNGVGVHNKQALVVVNPGHRTGASVLGFAKKIADSVAKEFGIELEIEPKVVGG